MSPGELRFIEPFLDKVCFVCAKKGKFRREKKALRCECRTLYMPMPGGKLAILEQPRQPVAAA